MLPPPLLNPGRALALALVTASGCLWFLSCTPFDLNAAAWIAAVPMLLAVDRAPTLRQALFLGWLAGFVETAGGFYWLIELMQRFGGLSWPVGLLVLIAFSAYRALIFLLFAYLVYRARRRSDVPMTVLAPLAMVGGELLLPQIFPCGQWITQAWHPLVIQIAELTGPLGVTALLLLVGGALYDLLLDARTARLPAIAAASLLAAVFAGGALRMQQVDAAIARAPRLQVGLVQPNFAYFNDEPLKREEILRELGVLQAETRKLERAGAALAVWSETSYPVVLRRETAADFSADSPMMIRRDIGIPVVVGAVTYDVAKDQVFNSALAFDRAGRVTGRYDKTRLLVFGEYIPGTEYFPWLRDVLPSGIGNYTPGKGPALLPVAGPDGRVWQLGPVICYEDILPSLLRGVGALHPDLLVNLTVDSWYGAHSEPWEHLALAVFASVELRVGSVRAVNSGVSTSIDANGRLLQKTYANDPYREPRAADGLLATAALLPGGHTLYVAAGDWFGWLCLAASLYFALGRRRREAAA